MKGVWEEGLGVPWPLKKADVGRLPRVGKNPTPRDEVVKAWTEAAFMEREPYMRAIILTELTYGWRPGNQLGRLRRAFVVHRDGKPFGVVADGAEADFKTPSPIVAWLVPEVAEAWGAMWKATPESPYIFPMMDLRGRFSPARCLDRRNILRIFLDFERKWSLPHLTPNGCRHWVKSALRRL